MKGKARPEVTGKMLVAYLEGEVTGSEQAIIEAELVDSAVCRRQLESLRHIRAALTTPIPEFEALDLVASLHCVANDEHPVRMRGTHFWNWRLMTAMAAAACFIAIGVSIRERTVREWRHPNIVATQGVDEGIEFRAKGAGSTQPGRGRWAGISVYRLGDDGKAEKLRERFSQGDGLLFAYSNLGPEPFACLMLFAVDASGRVFWYYPAYEREGTNPSSIALRRGQSAVELGEAVRHAFAAGPLELHALFSDEPLRVLEVEAWLRGNPPAESPLPWPRAFDQVTQLVVESAAPRAAPR